ncbi:MAG: hypothetical protein U0936_06895 [Planctomycetaceae bacterium]
MVLTVLNQKESRVGVHSLRSIAVIVLLFSGAMPGRSIIFAQATNGDGLLELNSAIVLHSNDVSARGRKAVDMLIDEVHDRSSIRWATEVPHGPSTAAPSIIVGTNNELIPILKARNLTLREWSGGAEGYQVQVFPELAVIVVSGHDERGVLFGVGRLLRELRMGRGRVAIPAGFSESSVPETKLRGHQLGYRPKTNSYDAWDVDQWEQYYRDLVVFGTNSIELIPPRSDDDADSPHFPRPPMEMMVEMSRRADEYGLDVWVWYPAMDEDYSKPETVEFALREWEEVYRQLPRIDAIFVPGGDPGHTPPGPLMALLEKQAALLRKYHPHAQMWMSPQGFNKAWEDEYFAFMKTEPAWLDGIVFGPQIRTGLPELRAKIPARYPLRGYPDITHTMNCQHPVENWDAAFAMTQGREAINPRPLSQAAMFRFYQPHTIGFLTYSEGCNDDVNKFVWSGLGWDSKADVREILRQYGRWFIGDDFAEPFANGVLGLEQNWNGPLLSNRTVETTLQQFRSIEQQASPKLLHNWRFQQALYRAYYDTWLRDRLVIETAQKTEAVSVLQRAAVSGSLVSMNAAEEILDRADQATASPALRKRIDELAEALFQSIHMQLDTKLHRGQLGRGTSQETIDKPLNDRHWMKMQFESIRKLTNEEERVAAIKEMLNRTDPGPGGFYDDLGDPGRQPHLVRPDVSYEQSPDFRKSIVHAFDFAPRWPREWWDNAMCMYDGSLQMQYEGLEPASRYKLRFVYAFEPIRKVPLQLHADGQQIHKPMLKPEDMMPLEFDIPAELTRDGELTLTWSREPGYGGNGRSCQVAEVWLIRIPELRSHKP